MGLTFAMLSLSVQVMNKKSEISRLEEENELLNERIAAFESYVAEHKLPPLRENDEEEEEPELVITNTATLV